MVSASSPGRVNGRTAGGRVTMQEVAAEAGVSVSTVSKVINGRTASRARPSMQSPR